MKREITKNEVQQYVAEQWGYADIYQQGMVENSDEIDKDEELDAINRDVFLMIKGLRNFGLTVLDNEWKLTADFKPKLDGNPNTNRYEIVKVRNSKDDISIARLSYNTELWHTLKGEVIPTPNEWRYLTEEEKNDKIEPLFKK